MDASQHPPKPRLVLHVGVTGHRHDDLVGRDIEAIRATVAAALTSLRTIVGNVHDANADAFDDRPPLLRVFSRLADGSDLVVAEVAVQHGYDLHCPLPFDRVRYEALVASDWRPLYGRMLEAASGILELDGDALGSAARRAALDEAFFESRRMVLRHSDVLIAIWDPEDRPSQVWGTTRLVNEARHDDLLVLHIDPKRPGEFHLDVRAEDADIHAVPADELAERLVPLLAPPARPPAHVAIVTPQSSGSTAYDDFLAERKRTWTLGCSWLLLRDLLATGRLTRPRIWVRGAVERAVAAWGGPWDTTPALPEAVRGRVDGVLQLPFAWADTLGDHYANLTRSAIVLNYAMAAGAVAMALAGYALGWTDEHHAWHTWAPYWTGAELALILAIVGNTYVVNTRRWHERWMDYRILAERIRLQRVLAPLGRILPHTRRPAHLSFGDLRQTWVGWYFRALVRELGMIGGRYDTVYVDAARATMTKLLEDTSEGQIGWHDSNATRCHKVEQRLHRAGEILFGVTGLACVVHLFAHWPGLTFVAATCPAFGAAAAAIAAHTQLDRIAKHSRAMAARLALLDAYLGRQPATSSAVSRPFEEIAECMAVEVLDWRSLFRGTLSLA